MAKNESLSPQQKRFLAALMECKTTAEAIRRANVAERSAYRWMREGESFKAALAEAEVQIMDAAMRRLLAMQATAIDALEALLTDPQARQSDKIRAVELALSHILRLRAATTLEERLNELERRIEEVRNEQHGRPVEAD